jgi:pimeloyl-ACP methyl ester carboxylesterase
VLVHGAWGGSHIWRLVRARLCQAGHEVFTPSLTGIGERVHLQSPQVNLTTHVLDVANTILYEDLSDVVLVGFSYGGIVVTSALRHVGERVRHLVYFDALVPSSGESLYELTGQLPRHAGLMGADWLVPFPQGLFGDDKEDQGLQARFTAHPAGCFEEPADLEHPLEDFGFTRTYVKATLETGVAGSAVWEAASRYRDHVAWRYREVPARHFFMLSHPAEATALLLELA